MTTKLQEIRTSIYNEALWLFLASDPTGASQVRSLEIKTLLPSRVQAVKAEPVPHAKFALSNVPDELVPPEVGSEEEEDEERRITRLNVASHAEVALIKALAHCTSLQNFAWHHTPPLFDTKYGRGAKVEGKEMDVWQRLGAIRSLKSVEVSDEVEYPREDWEGGKCDYMLPIESGSLYDSLSNLTSFSIYTSAWKRSTFTPTIERLHKLVSRCPQLESLRVDYILTGIRDQQSISGDNVLDSLRPLKSLRQLIVGDINATPEALERFLLAHPDLEVLQTNDHSSNSGPEDLLGQGQIREVLRNVKDAGGIPNLTDVQAHYTKVDF